MWRALLAALVLVPAAAAVGAPAATIVEVHPNPIAHGDAGEYLVIEFPAGTVLDGWSLNDGEGTAQLANRTIDGNRTVSGRVVVTTAPDAVTTDRPIVPVIGTLRLANAGERLRLLRDGEIVDRVQYADAPEGDSYRRSGEGWTWRPPGRSDLEPTVVAGVPVRTFVLPDAPQSVLAAVEGAEDRVILGGYTFSSRRIADALCAAVGRGVPVRVLVDREPVGGISDRSAGILDGLLDCGAAVRLIGGPGARYRFHHPKYAVVDDRAIVMTENWKPSGTGGGSNRGWGVVLRNETIADRLATTFESDYAFRDTTDWTTARVGVETVSANATQPAAYPERFAPDHFSAEHVELLAAPDNAEGRLIELIDGASRRIVVQQVSIDGPGMPLLEATIQAAERGVPVRVLLGSAWYVERDNRALVESLRRIADARGLPIEARLTAPRSRFEKLHVKGLIVDDTAIVGSANWNNVSLRDNREVLVLLRDAAAANYYARVFRADWRGGIWRLPIGFAVGAGGAMALSGIVITRRVTIDPDRRQSARSP